MDMRERIRSDMAVSYWRERNVCMCAKYTYICMLGRPLLFIVGAVVVVYSVYIPCIYGVRYCPYSFDYYSHIFSARVQALGCLHFDFNEHRKTHTVRGCLRALSTYFARSVVFIFDFVNSTVARRDFLFAFRFVVFVSTVFIQTVEWSWFSCAVVVALLLFVSVQFALV